MSSSTDSTEERCNFNKLPPELRTEIWKLAASNESNVLFISDREEVTVAIPPPAMAWTCQESRAIAFQYGHAYRVGDKWTWFSPEFDRLALDAAWTLRHSILSLVQGQLRVIAKSLLIDVRHALCPPRGNIYAIPVVNCWATCLQLNLWPIIAACPNLQTIGVMSNVGIVSGGKWVHSAFTQFLDCSLLYKLTVVHKLETESQIIDEISTKSFPRSSPKDWMGKSTDDGSTEEQTSQPMYQAQHAWDREKTGLKSTWSNWFFRHLATLTPTTLPSPKYTYTSAKFPWINQIKDQAPFVYPAILIAYGNRLLKAVDHPAFTRDELRQLQRYAMQDFLVDAFGDETLANADADEEAAT